MRRPSSASWSRPTSRTGRRRSSVHNIAATRAAFALDRRRGAGAVGRRGAHARRHRRNAATLKNVPLWDHQPLLDTFGQIQEIRTYYDFVSVDNDRYTHQRRVPADHAVGPRAELREPAEPQLDQRAAHLHPRLRPDARAGEPGHAAKACRCSSSRTCRRSPRVDLQVNEPSLYFGELSNDYVFVRTRTHGVPLPARATTTSTSTYDGERRRAAWTARSCGSCCSPSASARIKTLLQRRPHRREPRPVPPADRRARADASRRSSPTTPTRTWRSRTGGCSGSRTPTPTSTQLSLLDARRRTASTTSATP